MPKRRKKRSAKQGDNASKETKYTIHAYVVDSTQGKAPRQNKHSLCMQSYKEYMTQDLKRRYFAKYGRDLKTALELEYSGNTEMYQNIYDQYLFTITTDSPSTDSPPLNLIFLAY